MLMYLDGGANGVNKVSFYWNYARIFLDKRVTQISTGAIKNGMWFDVNYFYLGKITKFGWQ